MRPPQSPVPHSREVYQRCLQLGFDRRGSFKLPAFCGYNPATRIVIRSDADKRKIAYLNPSASLSVNTPYLPSRFLSLFSLPLRPASFPSFCISLILAISPFARGSPFLCLFSQILSSIFRFIASSTLLTRARLFVSSFLHLKELLFFIFLINNITSVEQAPLLNCL